jgi:Zn-dependent M28 family amino/carboxypeptidase
MAAIGLEPAGENGTFFQAVPLVRSTLDEAASSLTLAGPRGLAVSLSFGDDTVFWTKKTDPDLAFADSGLVFVGYGAVAPEYGWDDYAGLDVTGKTVVMLVNDPGYATGDPELFTGRAMTYYGRWTYKFEEAGRQGATAAIIVHETAPASYGWDVVEGSWTDAQFDLVRPDGGASRAALEGWVTREAAERLFAAAGLDFETMKAAAQERGFRPTPMGNLRASGRVVSDIVEMSSRNVAGLVRGTERPDEVVLMTAHWDHLGDRDVPPGEDGIYNGAVDNATGVSALLELARSFAALPGAPARSVAFLAVTAEESGLLGSAQYANDPPIPMNQTVAGLNMDALHVYGPTRDVVVVGYGSSELENILKEKAAQQGRVVEPEEHPERGSYYRSDHFNLARKGVPMLYAESGSDHLELGPEYVEARNREYLEKRYHSALDEITSDWDLRGAAQDIELYFRVGLEVADSERWPEWYEGNEFRSIREEARTR